MTKFKLLSAISLVTMVSGWCVQGAAEPPHVSYIFPAGGQRGTKVDFRVGGHYLHEKCPFEIIGDGVKAPSEIHRAEKTIWFEGPIIPFPRSSRKEDYPKDYLGQIGISENAALGVRYWRVWNSQGVNAAMPFVIGDLPEVIEQEIDGDPIPTPVTTPVTINGRAFPREDVDIWTVEAKKGQTFTCVVVAKEIGSPLDAHLQIRDTSGRVISETSGAGNLEPALRFTAQEAGVYQVRIRDVNFDGLQHFVYRLTITDGPWVDRVFPLGGQRGEKLTLELSGQHLRDKRLTVDVPGDADEPFGFHNEASQNAIFLDVDDLPETMEAEPNDDASKAQTVETPRIVNGRIEEAGDVDCWKFSAAKGDKLSLVLRAAQIGSPLDGVLTVTNETGKQLAKNDDAAGTSDPRIEFTAPADGDYVARVEERFSSRGGESFAYRLRIAKPKPDFELQLVSDALTVDRGGQQKLQLNIVRSGGFAQPIKLQIAGLPNGVMADPVEVKGNQPQSKATLTLKADAKARVGLSRIQVTGTSKLGDAEVSRTAKFRRRRGQPVLADVALAVAMPTPFKFTGEYAFTFVPCGGVHRKSYKIERGDYKGPLVVQMSDRQIRHLQGITGTTVSVPADANEFSYPIHLATWMVQGRTSRSQIMITGVVKDEEGREHKVCYTSGTQNDQIIVRPSPPLLQPTLLKPAIRAVPNSVVRVPVTIKRDPKLQGPIQLELLPPEHVADVRAEPIELPANETNAVLGIQFGPSPGPFNLPIQIRATGQYQGDAVIGETRLEFVAEED